MRHGHFDHQAALLDILKAKKPLMEIGGRSCSNCVTTIKGMAHSKAIPGSARLDAPGELDNVMERRIERRKIFFEDMYGEGFLLALEELVKEGAMEIYA